MGQRRRKTVGFAAALAATTVALGSIASAATGTSGTTDTSRALAALGKATAAADARYGDAFTEWNTTRNILRTEVNLVSGALDVHRSGIKGTGIDVALIDTGVAPVKYMNTADAVINGPDLSLDRQAGLPAGVDAYGHGTHLAGIIAGRDAGVAPGARLLNMKVGAADGAVDVSQVIAAIDWVVSHRKDPGMNVRVLNLAYGTDSVAAYGSSPLTHALESAWRAGIGVVVSAGNSGAALDHPANDPFVITVGAADLNDPYNTTDDQVAPYSAVGTSARGVDVLAPGTSITSLRTPGSTIDVEYPEASVLLGQYFKGSGTSQAAAEVSGAVALMLQAQPKLTPDQVKAILRSTATPIAGAPTNAQGGGVINVGKAVAAGATPPATTQTWTKSKGTGTIESARGTAHLVADDGTILQGEVDVQGAAWKGSVWAPKSTAGTAWSNGTWNGNVWAGAAWETATTIDGVAWTGRSWRSLAWSGRSWRADLWAGRSWRAESWAGRSWRGDKWA